jgi:hypothetical protein
MQDTEQRDGVQAIIRNFRPGCNATLRRVRSRTQFPPRRRAKPDEAAVLAKGPDATTGNRKIFALSNRKANFMPARLGQPHDLGT